MAGEETGYPHVYFGGRWVTRAQAVVPVDSLALRYGLSVFEGIRAYAPEAAGPPSPFLLSQHLDRLAGSLLAMRFPDPGLERVPAVVEELLTRNAVTGDAYVRVAATPLNAGLLGAPARPEISATVVPMGRKPWLAEDKAMSLKISDWQRGSARVHPPAAKNIANYAGPRLAWQEAQTQGFDGCVLTNRHDRLAEAPTAALFLVRAGVLRTPALTEDVLPSITRAWVLRTAGELGLEVEEAELARGDAYDADEAFLCGTALEISAVRAFDGVECRAHRERPITRRLVDRYFHDARGGCS